MTRVAYGDTPITSLLFLTPVPSSGATPVKSAALSFAKNLTGLAGQAECREQRLLIWIVEPLAHRAR